MWAWKRTSFVLYIIELNNRGLPYGQWMIEMLCRQRMDSDLRVGMVMVAFLKGRGRFAYKRRPALRSLCALQCSAHMASELSRLKFLTRAGVRGTMFRLRGSWFLDLLSVQAIDSILLPRHPPKARDLPNIARLWWNHTKKCSTLRFFYEFYCTSQLYILL